MLNETASNNLIETWAKMCGADVDSFRAYAKNTPGILGIMEDADKYRDPERNVISKENMERLVTRFYRETKGQDRGLGEAVLRFAQELARRETVKN